MTATNHALLFIGSYNSSGPGNAAKSDGIHVFDFDLDRGVLRPIAADAHGVNPSFLCLQSGGRFLYAVDETAEFEGQPGGSVSAYALSPDGRLQWLNTQATAGAHPCHLCLDQNGKWLAASNYSGGSLALFPVTSDGRLGERRCLLQNRGKGSNPQRQQSPHVHSSIMDPQNRLLLVADLGLDRVFIYQLDGATGALTPHTTPWFQSPPGSGPRHMAFDPTGRFLYIVNEIDSTLTACTWDAQRGGLAELQTLPLLPADFTGQSTAADIHLLSSGKFLYASNRGHDSIAIFAADSATGRLTALGHVPTGGRTPRGFAIDPSDRFCLVANQDSDSVIVFRIDPATGMLAPTGQSVAIPKPVHVLFNVRGRQAK
jgi:6-phosphogluconolactonase